MSVAASCSWCHTNNTLVPGCRNLCRHCGHRADLARMMCDCPQCVGLFSPPVPPVTVEELEALFEEHNSGKKGGGS